MNLEIKGTIKTIGETIEGGKGDKTWQKMFYTIDTGEQYDNIIQNNDYSNIVFNPLFKPSLYRRLNNLWADLNL